MIEWSYINESSMMLVLTFVYVITTIGILLSTRHSNKLTKEAMAQTVRPFVLVDLYPEDKFIYLRLKNTGVTPAIDVSITFDSDVKILNSKLNSSTLKNLPVIGPTQEIKFFMDERTSFITKNKGIIAGKVSYRDIFSGKYEESISIDMRLYSEIVRIS